MCSVGKIPTNNEEASKNTPGQGDGNSELFDQQSATSVDGQREREMATTKPCAAALLDAKVGHAQEACSCLSGCPCWLSLLSNPMGFALSCHSSASEQSDGAEAESWLLADSQS